MPKPWSSDSPLSAPTSDDLLLKEFRREQVGADEMVYCYVNPNFLNRITVDEGEARCGFYQIYEIIKGDKSVKKEVEVDYSNKEPGEKFTENDIKRLAQFCKDIDRNQSMYAVPILQPHTDSGVLLFDKYNAKLVHNLANYSQHDPSNFINSIFNLGINEYFYCDIIDPNSVDDNSFCKRRLPNFLVFSDEICSEESGCCFYFVSIDMEYTFIKYIDFNNEKKDSLHGYFLDNELSSTFMMLICTKHFFDYVNNFDFTATSFNGLMEEKRFSKDRKDFYSAAKCVSLLREFINEEKDFKEDRCVRGILDPLKKDSCLFSNLDSSLYHAYRAIEKILDFDGVSSLEEFFSNKYPYYKSIHHHMGALNYDQGSNVSVSSDGKYKLRIFKEGSDYKKDTSGEELYQREEKIQLEYIKQKNSLLKNLGESIAEPKRYLSYKKGGFLNTKHHEKEARVLLTYLKACLKKEEYRDVSWEELEAL